ncbi:MAG: hypothetical protein RL215_3290 [Planctomycetota bacterium]
MLHEDFPLEESADAEEDAVSIAAGAAPRGDAIDASSAGFSLLSGQFEFCFPCGSFDEENFAAGVPDGFEPWEQFIDGSDGADGEHIEFSVEQHVLNALGEDGDGESETADDIFDGCGFFGHGVAECDGEIRAKDSEEHSGNTAA